MGVYPDLLQSSVSCFICQIESLNILEHLLLLWPSVIFNKILKAFPTIKKMGIMKDYQNGELLNSAFVLF